MLTMVRAILRRSKQRINERRDARAAEHDQQSGEKQQHENRRKPPLLVVRDEIEKLGQHAALFAAGLLPKGRFVVGSFQSPFGLTADRREST